VKIRNDIVKNTPIKENIKRNKDEINIKKQIQINNIKLK